MDDFKEIAVEFDNAWKRADTPFRKARLVVWSITCLGASVLLWLTLAAWAVSSLPALLGSGMRMLGQSGVAPALAVIGLVATMALVGYLCSLDDGER